MLSKTFLSSLAVAMLCVNCAAGSSSYDRTAAVDNGAQHSPPSPENHRLAALRLFEQMQMQKMLDSLVENLMKTQMSQNPELGEFADIMREFFAKYMSWKSLEDDYLRIYLKTFTQQELEDIVAFYSTPTGKKTIVVMPDLIQQGAAIGQSRVQEHITELQQKIAQRVMELKGSEPEVSPSHTDE